MPASYLSPKTRIAKSLIEGHGLFARGRIAKGEIVAIKGGKQPFLQRRYRGYFSAYLAAKIAQRRWV